jgi:hypothetical protein
MCVLAQVAKQASSEPTFIAGPPLPEHIITDCGLKSSIHLRDAGVLVCVVCRPPKPKLSSVQPVSKSVIILCEFEVESYRQILDHAAQGRTRQAIVTDEGAIDRSLKVVRGVARNMRDG